MWRRESRPLLLILLKNLIIYLFLPPNLPPNDRLMWVPDCEELVGVTGDDGAEMLISAFRSRRSISGPEMDV